MHIKPQTAVVIGRFQPFHQGHAVLLELALATAQNVVVVLGSSFHARTTKNPFSVEERINMISDSLLAEERPRVRYVAIRDYYDDARWAASVRAEVEKQVSDRDRIALIGHFKDASSYYLNLFPHWELISTPAEPDYDATGIRQKLFEAVDPKQATDNIGPFVPRAVLHNLEKWMTLPIYGTLIEEYRQLRAYKIAWQVAPYPPIFCTVDSVVKTNNHVLLIQRGGFPGKGLWALPGGFLEQHERLKQGAIRELREETKLGLTTADLEQALVSVTVFDHPDRSLRNRTITHAHFFDLKTNSFPLIEGADDAALANWVPIDQLSKMEECFFDDHFHILDHFLNLTMMEAP